MLLWEDECRESFGDIDVYVYLPRQKVGVENSKDDKTVEIIQHLFLPEMESRQGNVYSFVLESVQIDVIMMKNEFAKIWYGLSLGMCIGESLKQFGWVLRDTGFYIDIKDGKGQTKTSFLLTDDPTLFLCFLEIEMRMDREFMIQQLQHACWFRRSNNTNNIKKKKYHHFYTPLMESAPLVPHLPTSRSFSYALDYFKKTVEYDQKVNEILQREREEYRKSYVRKMVLSFIREKGLEKEQIQKTGMTFGVNVIRSIMKNGFSPNPMKRFNKNVYNFWKIWKIWKGKKIKYYKILKL